MTPDMRRLGLTFLMSVLLGGVAFAAGQTVNVPEDIDAQMRADPECYNYDESHMKEARETAQLTENHTLYLLPCFSGAYNLVYRVYVLDKRYPDEVKPSLFAGYSDENGWYGKRELINAYYDPKTKMLSAFEKSRGLGDCGSAPRYKWNDYGWRMLEYRYWGKCDGSRMPEQWPVIYKFNGN